MVNDKDALSAMLDADAMQKARWNAMQNVGVNPDAEAELQRKAKVAGISAEEARVVNPIELERMYASQFVSNLELPLATRKLMADDQLSRLVATNPIAYENLSFVDQLISRIGKGFAIKDVSDAYLSMEAARNPLARYDVDAEREGDGTDFSFLEKWANRPNSPLMQASQDKIRERSYEIARANYELQQYTTPQAMQEVSDAKTVGEALGAALSHPIDVMLGTGLESLGSMGVTLPITAAAYAVGGPLLGAVSMGLSSYNVEFGNSINDALTEAGVDMTDPNAVREAFNNTELMTDIVRKATAKASSVGAFDTVAGMIAPIRLSPATASIAAVKALKGKLTGKGTSVSSAVNAAKKNLAEDGDTLIGLTVADTAKRVAKTEPARYNEELVRELDNMFGQMVVGGTLGGAGEAVGQLASEGKITSIGDIVLEAVADLASAPVDVLMARADARRLVEHDRVSAERAKQTAQVIVTVLDKSKTNELNARSPKTYQDFLNDAAEGYGVDNLSANVQTLKELGVYDALLDAAPHLRAQATLAEATGGDIDIQLGDLSALNDASPDMANKAVSAVRSSSEGMSLLEAQEFDEQAGTKLSEAAQKIIEEESNALTSDIALRNQVNEASKGIEKAARAYFGEEQAAQVTMLQKSILYSLSKRLGIAPKDLLTIGGNVLSFDNRSRSKTKKGSRGTFTPSTNKISVFKNGDVRTFTHEMAHFWLESLTGVAYEILDKGAVGTPEAEETLAALDGVMRWLGVKGDTVKARLLEFITADVEMKRPMHERFAEGFETYLAEGKVPETGVAKAFEMLKQWVKDSWKFLGIHREELSPEILSLYDSLFLADQAAADAISAAGTVSDVRAKVMKETMTPEEYEAYMRTQEEVTKDVSAEVGAVEARNKKLINSRREREARGLTAEYKAELKAETDKVLATRPYQTLAALSSKVAKRADGIRFKLVESTAQEVLSPETFKYAKEHGWMRKSGEDTLSASDAAELLGYRSAEEMVADAINADKNPAESIAKAKADESFLKKYGAKADQRNINRIASDAVYGSTRLMMLASEFRALKKINSPLRSVISAAKAFAEDILSGRKVVSLRARKYQQAATRARKAADRALAKGDRELAAEFTRAELLQTALANETTKALKRIDAFHKRLAKAVKSNTIDFAHRDQLINLAVRSGFLSSKALKEVKAPSLKDFILKNGYQFDIGVPLDEIPFDVPASEMTVEQYDAMIKVVDVILNQGRAKHKADKSEAKGSVNARKAELNATLKTNAESMGRKARVAVVTETRPWMKAKDTFVGFFHTHVKMSTWARIFDGNTFGAWFENIIRPANKLSDKETKWNAKLTKDLDDILKPFFEGNPNGDWVEIDGVRYNLQQRFVIALNAGNDVNMQRVIDGNGFTREQIGKIMASLTDGQLAAVQRIWDVFESLRPEIAKLEYKLNGKEPNWTEPVPIEVERPDGRKVTLRGGHYPIVYDYTSPGAASSAIARDMENAERAAIEGGHTGVTTTRTYTKDRSDKGLGIPVNTALAPMFSKLQEVVHDLTWREFLLDMQRLRADSKTEDGTVIPSITSTISTYYGATAAKQFDAWLQNIAYGNRRPPSGSLDQYASRLRRGVSISGLGFNIVSAAVQITGLIPAMTRLGVGGVASAVSDYFGNVRDHTISISAKSDFMANRARTFLRELDEINNRIEGGQSKAAKALRGVQDSAYMFMAYVQNHIDRIVWLGAYKKATLEGLSEEDCVARADQTVKDTQGSGLLADMSAAEMGSLAKLFTSFYSFMNTAYNLNAAALLGERDRYKAAGNILTVSVGLPIIEGVLRSALAPGGDDDDDKDWTKYAREAAGNVVNFNLGLLVFTREMSSMAGNFVAGEPVFTWRGPSSLRVISDVGQVLSQSAQGEFDKALVKSIVNAAGATFALPAAQVNRTIDGFEALLVEEKTRDPSVLIRGYKGN